MTAQMNFPFKIARHDTIEFDGRKYSFNQAAGGGHLLLTDLETGNPLQIENKATGGLMLPTVQWFLDMMRDRRIVLRREKLPSVIRQQEREKQRDAADIRALDPRADARLEVLRYMDTNNVPMSDKKIDAALDILCTEEWIAKFGARPGLSTVRHWMIFRGRPGERFLRDCFSVAGRTKRARRMHPTLVSIFAYHQLDFFTNQGLNMYEMYMCACADIFRVNKGEKTAYGESYPQPEQPFKLPAYETFRRGVKQLLSTESYGAKFGNEAKNSRTRGAGKPLRASRALEIVTGDTWEVPGYFCIDAESGMPMGTAYYTNFIDVYSKATVAWVLECAPPTTTTMGKLFLHLGSSKTVAPYFGESFPSLQALCGKPGEVIFDNALYQLARTVEDEGADTGIAIRFAGANEPRHKAAHERAYGAIKTFLFDKLPGAKFDIKLMREFGFDPMKHKVVTFGELHALFQEVIDFKNTNEHKGLGGRQPLAVFEESARRHGIDLFPDLDKLENVIGDVFYGRVLQKSGIELWGMRFGGAEEVPELLDDLMGTEVRRTQNPTVTVKVKGNRDNIGSIKVWNPVRGRYMPLINQTVEEAEGMPLWLHERAVAFAKAEGLAFRTVEERVFARERMVRLAREIQPEAKAKERRTLAKLASLPIVDEIIGKSISIDRVLKNPTDVINPVPFDLAAPTRKDAEVEPVRSARVRDADDEADRDRRDAGSPNKLTNAKRDVRDAGAAKPVKAKKSKTPKPRKAAWGDFS